MAPSLVFMLVAGLLVVRLWFGGSLPVPAGAVQVSTSKPDKKGSSISRLLVKPWVRWEKPMKGASNGHVGNDLDSTLVLHPRRLLGLTVLG